MKIVRNILVAIIRVVLSPLTVIFEQSTDKVIHFFVFGMTTFTALFIGLPVWIAVILIPFIAVFKEEFLDKKPDSADAYWSWRGIFWFLFLYLIFEYIGVIQWVSCIFTQ